MILNFLMSWFILPVLIQESSLYGLQINQLIQLIYQIRKLQQIDSYTIKILLSAIIKIAEQVFQKYNFFR